MIYIPDPKPSSEQKKHMVNLLKGILSGKEDVIITIREIYFSNLIEIVSNQDLVNFCTLLEDETETIPKGRHRKYCSEKFLKEKDQEEVKILEFYKNDIVEFAQKTLNLLRKK